jgi:hypothetical protein
VVWCDDGWICLCVFKWMELGILESSFYPVR